MRKLTLAVLAIFSIHIGSAAALGLSGNSSQAISGTTTSGLSGSSCLSVGVCSATFNLVSGFGAACNGVADDGPALTASSVPMRTFQTANPGAPVTLIIPPGSNCLINTCPTASDGGTAFSSITNITIIATGATITIGSGGCTNWAGSVVNPWTADKFNPNTIGDTCVTMTVPGAEANYPVGRWVLIGGQGVQVNSFPPNYANWEFQQVASDTGGKVCFTAPMVNFYPNDARAGIDLTGQNCSNNYCGGPGALTLMIPAWGGYFHTIGGTWHADAVGGTHWSMKTVIFDNVNWPAINPLGSNQCWFPTLLGTVTFNNSTFTNCNVEVDKEIDQIIVNNSSFRVLQFQSPSYHSIAMNNGSSASLEGTPPLTTCNNSTIGLGIGSTFGSFPTTFVGVNCTFNITGIPFNGFTLDHVNYTYASGTFSIPNVDVCGGFPQWFSTGGRMAMSIVGGGVPDADNYFTITGASVPISPPLGANCTQTISVTTTLPNVSDPPPAFVTGGSVFWAVDQARNMSCTGCAGRSGDNTAFDLNFPAAQGQPLFTYANRTYTCANNIPNVAGSLDINAAGGDSLALRGAFGSAVINVITADTNPSDSAGKTLFMRAGSLFRASDGASTFQGTLAIVNLLITGTRTILPGSTSGAQSGDTLNTPTYGASTWVAGSGAFTSNQGNPITNGPAAQCPVVQMTWQTTR
jgi:hypothetical protein